MQHHQESSGPGFDISNLHVRSGDKWKAKNILSNYDAGHLDSLAHKR